MSAHRRTARALSLGASGTAATTAYLALTLPYAALATLYVTAVLAWFARSYYRAHHRTLAEEAWEEAYVLGEQPAPLNPCCALAHHSGGAAHDRRCTDEFHRLTADLATEPWSST
ncbi:hypothetical protein [Streptomyces sp. NPDC047042]|uniref:hypothetical protein n=1 Tax=Streptomyces sp. NPDC047042 TaxID=3154807 RepID=UPI0033FE9212